VLGKVEWDIKRVRGIEQCVETDLERVERECRDKSCMPRMGCESKGELTGVERAGGAQGSGGWEVGDGGDGGRKSSPNEPLILAAQELIQTLESREETQEEPPQKLVIVLRFQLGTSMYATMALREVMKAGGVQSYQPEFGHAHAR